MAATPERYGDAIPLTGFLSVSVPGMVDALLESHGRHGTLPLARCLETAIALCEDGVPMSHFQARIAPPPVPCTAIYTRDDGIVSWPCCLENDSPNTDNVEVAGTHVGLPWNPAVLAAIAERLARYDSERDK